MNNDDWIPGHLTKAYAPFLGLRGGERWETRQSDRELRYDTKVDDGPNVGVDVRRTRFENAGEYRAWLPCSPAAMRAAIAPRPVGWRLFTLVVGELPNGEPWWTALWDLDVIRREGRQVAEPMNDGRWYRVNPAKVPAESRPAVWDFIQPDLGLLSAPTALDGVLDLEKRMAKASDAELDGVDQVLLRVRREIRSERERRAAAVAV